MKLSIQILFILLLSFVSQNINAQISGSVESMNRITENKSGIAPQINIYLRGKVHSGFSWTVWALNNKNWSETYAGLIYSPADWIESSINYGLEPGGERYGSSLWAGYGPVSAFIIHENGVSGWWVKSIGSYKVVQDLSVGYHTQRGLGVGPYVSYKINSVLLWGSYLHSSQNTMFVCARLVF